MAGWETPDSTSSWRTWGIAAVALAVAAVVAAGVALTALGGSESDDDRLQVAPADAEVAYLEGVAAVQALRDAQDERLRELLDQAYPIRARLWQVAEDIELRAATDDAIAAAASLDPPRRYEAPHDSWVAALRASRRHLEASQDALERQELVEMIVAFMRAELELAARLPEWPEAFCRAAIPTSMPGGVDAELAGAPDAGGPDVVCRRDVPGGAYGEQLHAVVLRTELEVGRRIGLSGLVAFTDEERMAFLRVIQPEVQERFEEALAAVRSLDPPADRAADHALVVGFYEDILHVARRITAAAEDGDHRRFQALARDSFEPGTTLRQELSEQGCAILDGFTFFTDSRGCR